MWAKAYTGYWKKRTQENIDKPPGEKQFGQFFCSMIMNKKLLDAGCGFGRFFPIFIENGLDIYGIDISQDMIDEARKVFGDDTKELKVGRLENIEYPDDFFDIVVAWAVFDAVQQEKALKEILRVLKFGGMALITGKNDNYFEDDDQAIVAEEMARRKKHPNYFTNYPTMQSQIWHLGGIIVNECFFLRRGDFGNSKFLMEQPKKFYEWCIFIEKAYSAPDEGKTKKCSFSSSSSLVGNKIR